MRTRLGSRGRGFAALLGSGALGSLTATHNWLVSAPGPAAVRVRRLCPFSVRDAGTDRSGTALAMNSRLPPLSKNPLTAHDVYAARSPSGPGPPYQRWKSSQDVIRRGCTGPRRVGPTKPAVLVLTPS